MWYLVGFLIAMGLFYKAFENFGWGWLIFIAAIAYGIYELTKYPEAKWKAAERQKQVEREEAAQIAEEARQKQTAYAEAQRQEQKQALMNKYGIEADHAMRLLQGELAIGDTEEMVREAWGEPEAKKSKDFTKIWGFERMKSGKNPYKKVVFLEKGVVVEIIDRVKKLMADHGIDAKRAKLMIKLDVDSDCADRLARGLIEIGDTEEMVRAGLGEPELERNRQELQKGKRVTWCYDQIGKNQYRTKVTLLNGAVEKIES